MKRKVQQQPTMKIPQPLYDILKREAQARGCFMWKVLDDALKCYLSGKEEAKK
jgi:hypothetical protein